MTTHDDVVRAFMDCTPPASLYDMEFSFWPWGEIADHVVTTLKQRVPRDGCVLDLMCGTGFILNRLAGLRPDLRLYGCSLTQEEVEYARERSSGVHFACHDALSYAPPEPVDVAICTGGLHHLLPGERRVLLGHVKSILGVDGWALIVDETIESPDPQARRSNVIQLWSEVMQYAVARGGPPAVIHEAVRVLLRDLEENGEYKMSEQQLVDVIREHFMVLERRRLWPEQSMPFGETLIIASHGCG